MPDAPAFSEQLAKTLERQAGAGQTFAVLCLDLDRFKEINDVFGHFAGDALLQEVSRRMHSATEGAFLARLGGDEFTIIAVEGPHPAAAATLADRPLAAMAGGGSAMTARRKPPHRRKCLESFSPCA